MDKPILSKRLFLGVDMDKINYKANILNVLERIMYKGSREDLIAAREFYGDNNIRKEIVRSKCFGPKEVNFCCLIFDLKITDFVYYKEGQFKAYPEFKNCPEDFIYPDYFCS